MALGNLKNSVKKQAKDVLAKVNIVNTILTSFPVLYQTDSIIDQILGEVEKRKVNFSFEFFIELLGIMGIKEEQIYGWFASLLAGSKKEKDKSGSANTSAPSSNGLLNVIEYAIKGVLLANFKNLFTCEMNPIIPDWLMDKNSAIELNLKSLDLYGLLNRCPTTKYKGKNLYYFDVGGESWPNASPSDMYMSCDFNAFLWHCVHKGAEMEHVWDDRVKYINKIISDEGFRKEFINAIEKGDEDKPSINFTYKGSNYKKKNIIHVSYKETTRNNIYGTNVIKFWLDEGNYKASRGIIKKNKFTSLYKEHKERKPGPQPSENDTAWQQGRKNIKNKLNQLADNAQNAYNGAVGELNKGFYMNKTIFEFNYDFVWNMKLFDTLSLTTTIVNNILSTIKNLKIDVQINCSEEEEFFEQIVTHYINTVMNEDEFEYDTDDYFSFSNEEYETMLTNAINNTNDRNNLSDTESYEQIYSDEIKGKLVKIGYATNGEEEKEAITDTLKAVQDTIKQSEKTAKAELSINGNNVFNVMNLFQIFAQQTLTQVVAQALSPKVYTLYMINSIVMGNIEYIWDPSQRKENGNDIVFKSREDFIKNFKNLIKNIVKQVKDILLKQLYQTVLNYIKQVVTSYLLVLIKEKLSDYIEILLNILGLLLGAAEMLSSVYALIKNIKELKNFLKTAGESNNNNIIENVTYIDMVPEKTEPT